MKYFQLPNSVNSIPKLALLVILLTGLTGTTAQAEYTNKLIALGGMDAPGIPGAKFSASFPPIGMALSDNGKVLYRATLEIGPGSIGPNNDEGIWVYENGETRLLVQKGGPVPRFTQVQLFEDRLPQVFMGPDGQIGMDAWYSEDGTFNNAVHAFFLEENGQMHQKFTSTDALPTGDTLFAASVRAFNAGRFLFTGAVRGPTVVGSQDAIIAEYGPDGFNILTQSEHPLPGVDGGWLFTRSSHQRIITAAGKTVFGVQAGRTSDNSGIGVVYSWDPINGHIPLRVSAIDETFAVFGNYQLNTQGNNVNRSWNTFGVTYGLFNTNDELIISEGDFAEGADVLSFFTAFLNYVIFDNDSIVFEGVLSDGKQGIWGGDVNGVKKIALIGDPAPGRPGNFEFFRVNNMEINRSGQVAFSDLAVDPITDDGYSGVWIGRTGRGLQLITQTGDIVDVPAEISNDVTLTLEDAQVINASIPRTGADGLFSGLNEHGEILLFATFTGFRFGLMIATPGGMVVNSNGDDPDVDLTDGICDTGNKLPDGSPECTLRAALMEADVQVGSITIDFDIEGSTVISPQSALPGVPNETTIDGNTQPDGRPIVIDGINAGAAVNGLELPDGGATISGLEIGRFTAAGIKIAGSRENTSDINIIIDCYLGLRSDSPLEFGNLGDGINVAFGNENFIGSPDFTRIVLADDSRTRDFAGWNYISGNSRDGIRIAQESNENTVWHNIIGLREDGTELGNGGSGVMILDSDKNIVGGVENQQRNIIANNIGDGVTISPSATSTGTGTQAGVGAPTGVPRGAQNYVLNNFIGLTKDGQAAGNAGNGVAIFSDSCTIGGAADSGNVISNNSLAGITIRSADFNRLSGNYIGVDTIGLTEMPNQGDGVEISSSNDTQVGGPMTINGELDQGNILSGNRGAGINVEGSQLFGLSEGTRIIGNFIGIGIDNNTALPNAWGVRVSGAPGTAIGSSLGKNGQYGNQIRENAESGIMLLSDGCIVNANRIEHNGFAPRFGVVRGGHGIVIEGFGNFITFPFFPATQVIARNNGAGVRVVDSPDFPTNGNTINFNSIFANVEGGIDLGPNGPNGNDALDADGGANDGQNSPRLLSVDVNESNDARIIGLLNSKPNQEYQIVAYSNDACDTAGLGQGQLWIGGTVVNTDASGAARIDFTTGILTTAPTKVTLTATDQFGSTSEFSNCGAITSNRVDLVVNKSDDADSVSVDNQVRYEIIVTNQGPDSATGVTLVDSLPVLLSYVADSSDHGPCVFSDGILNCDLGTIKVGDSAIIILIANANANGLGLIENQAVAFATEIEENPLDNFDIDSTISSDIQTDVGEDDGVVLPRKFSLAQNHPNPFNPTTVISYALPKKAEVTISIYNILGQNVRTLKPGTQSAGRYSITWNATDDDGNPVSSGMYFYKLLAGNFAASRKMVLLK